MSLTPPITSTPITEIPSTHPAWNITTVPNEIFLLFFKILGDASTAAICGRVCTHWKQILENDLLWTQFYRREFGQEPKSPTSVKMQFAAEMLRMYRLTKGMCILTPVAPELDFHFKEQNLSQRTVLTGNFNYPAALTGGNSKEGILIIDINSGKFQHLKCQQIHLGAFGATLEKCGNWLVEKKHKGRSTTTKIWNLSTNVLSGSYEKESAPACGEKIWLWERNVPQLQLLDLASNQEIIATIPVTPYEVYTIDENFCLIVTSGYYVQLWSYNNEPKLIGSVQLSRLLSAFHFIVCDNALVYFDFEQEQICRYDFKTSEKLTFQCDITNNRNCDLISKGPQDTIFYADSDGLMLLEEKTLKLKASFKYAEHSLNKIGRFDASILLNNNNILMSACGKWFIWNWSTNNCTKLAGITSDRGQLLYGPNESILYQTTSECLQLNTDCSTASWLQNLANSFETQELCISIMYEICALVDKGELPKEIIKSLDEKRFFQIPGRGEKADILFKWSNLRTLANTTYKDTETQKTLTRISDRFRARTDDEINDNLNKRFLMLPGAMREDIIEQFDKLIAHLHLEESGEKAFLESDTPFRSRAINQYIATLGKPAPQKPLFTQLQPKHLFKNFDLNAVATKLLNKQTVSSQEYMALFLDEVDFFEPIEMDRDYFHSIFQTSQDLEKIGMDIFPCCCCQKIAECLFPRTDVKLNALEPHLTALIDYIEGVKEKPIDNKQLNRLKAILNSQSISYTDADHLSSIIYYLKYEERVRQEFLLKKHLDNLPETVAPRLRKAETVSALEYLMVLGINTPTDISQALSIRPDFLQQIGISSSEDLKAIGLQFDLIDQMEQMSAILEKYNGEENHGAGLETVGDLPNVLLALIKNAQKSINFVEMNAVSLQGCDLEQYQIKLNVLKSYLSSFADDKKDSGSLSSWTVYCKSVLQELHEFEILRQKDLLRAYCLQPGILETWKTLDRTLTLSTLQSSPENVFTMGS